MIGEGWRFEELMAMSARDFAFWLDAQEELSRRRAEEAQAARDKG